MAQDLLNEMRIETDSEYVAYTEFMLSYKKGKDIIYCFYEGSEDKRYYGVRIEHIACRNYENFTCCGKDNVLGIMRLMKQQKEYDNVETMFFIDNDYKTLISDKKIYITPCYSIENFYTSNDALTKILRDEFDLKINCNDFNTIFSIYNSLKNKFHSELLFFNSWLACQNDIRLQNKRLTYLKIDKTVNEYFDSIVLSDLKSISDFSDLNDLNKIESFFPDSPKIDFTTLTEKIELFKSCDPEKSFRGKFEIKFFISFLLRLKEEIGKKKSLYFENRYKCNLRFENATAISLLTQFADTPECLVKYLIQYKKSA